MLVRKVSEEKVTYCAIHHLSCICPVTFLQSSSTKRAVYETQQELQLQGTYVLWILLVFNTILFSTSGRTSVRLGLVEVWLSQCTPFPAPICRKCRSSQKMLTTRRTWRGWFSRLWTKPPLWTSLSLSRRRRGKPLSYQVSAFDPLLFAMKSSEKSHFARRQQHTPGRGGSPDHQHPCNRWTGELIVEIGSTIHAACKNPK